MENFDGWNFSSILNFVFEPWNNCDDNSSDTENWENQESWKVLVKLKHQTLFNGKIPMGKHPQSSHITKHLEAINVFKIENKFM